MSFTLKDIKGAVVDKNVTMKWVNCMPSSENILQIRDEVIDAQSSVRLRFNREKLAVILGAELCKSWAKYVQFYGQPPHGTENQILALMELGTLDAIIAYDKDIVELCTEENPKQYVERIKNINGVVED